MVVPSQKHIDLIEFYTPEGSEDDLWRDSLLMTRTFVEYIQRSSDKSKKQAILQLTNLSISDPAAGASAKINAWNGYYVIDYIKKVGDGQFENVTAGTTNSVEEAVRLMYVAFEESARAKKAACINRP